MSARVIITGARGGIGSATVAELQRRGAQVVGLDLPECDVRSQQSVDAAVAAAVERLGGLDVLINNAGLGTPQSAAAAPDADALDVLAVNLVGPWRVTSAALEALRASRGRVVNVASGLAHITVPFAPAYTMSKRGVVASSDSLRLEEAPPARSPAPRSARQFATWRRRARASSPTGSPGSRRGGCWTGSRPRACA